MMDANQGEFLQSLYTFLPCGRDKGLIKIGIVWDVDQAIEWSKKLAKYNLWFIEEPTAPYVKASWSPTSAELEHR